MEIRDEMALAILPAIYTEYFADCRFNGTGPQDETWRLGIAIDAYRMADAMLAANGSKSTDNVPGFGDMPEFPTVRVAKE